MTKAEIRREMRSRLAALSAVRTEKSRAIVDALARHPSFGGTRRVALYSPIPSEPDIEALWEHSAHRFCYPRVSGKEMDFVDVRQHADLTTSQWHPDIRELAGADARIVAPAEIEIILVPGLAFTRDGHRLGRGGGYYDRYLASLPPATLKIGVCFATQIVNALPIEPHDQTMNAIVTEDGFTPTPPAPASQTSESA